jgi:hypothetical protein
MVFGLLSGNNNIIRLPSKKFFQIEILCKILKKLSKKKNLKKILTNYYLLDMRILTLISSELIKRS